MKVLGIDPSYRNFALVLGEVKDNELISVTEMHLAPTESVKGIKLKSHEHVLGSRQMYLAMSEMSQGVTHIFAEVPTGSQSATAAKMAGMCVGVLGTFSAPITLVTPIEVKKATVGDRKATKEQMIEWATTLYPEAPWLRQGTRVLKRNEHFADAIGAIHAGLRKTGFGPTGLLKHATTGVYHTDPEWPRVNTFGGMG